MGTYTGQRMVAWPTATAQSSKSLPAARWVSSLASPVISLRTALARAKPSNNGGRSRRLGHRENDRLQCEAALWPYGQNMGLIPHQPCGPMTIATTLV